MKTMKWNFKLLAAIAFVATVALVQSCKDEDPTPLELSTVTVGGADLNGATSPTGVATNAAIEINFSTNVDVATATTSNIKLVRKYDNAEAPVTVTPSGSKVTVTPTGALSSGNVYELSVSEAVMSDKGLPLTKITRTFTTAGFFDLPGQAAYWPMNDNGDDVVGNFDVPASAAKDIVYEAGRNTASGKAAKFNGTTSIMEAPGADAFLNGKDFTISFWVKQDGSNTKSNFVLGLAAWKGFQFEIDGSGKAVKLASQYNLGKNDPVTGNPMFDSEDNWINSEGKTKDNGGWQGWTVNKAFPDGIGNTLFKDKWAHVVCTYNSTTKVATMYVNNDKVKQHDFNLWPADSPKRTITGVAYQGNPAPGNTLAFGFIQGSQNRTITDAWADYANPANNHFKGWLDDVRIWKKALTDTEVGLIYNSEK